MNIKSILVIALIIVSSMAGAMGSEESENLRAVQQAIIDAGADWEAGITSMSGLTDVEKRLLALPDPIPEPDGMIVTAPAMRALQHEERFDWRDTGKVTPVRHQGSCGSCWAFGAIGAVESAFLIHTEKNLDLSEQHLVSSCCNAGSCNGGWPDWALDYIRNTGVPDETCYPYKARNTACDPCAGWEDRAYKIKDHVYVEPSTDDFKWALKEYGPISVVLEAPDDWYYYHSGVYSPVTDVGWANHAVLLTGWDDSDGCWFIKNSWGSGWGEHGYARVKYGNLEKYNYAYAITGVIDHGASPDPGTWTKPVSAMASSEYSESYASSKSIDNQTNTHWFSKRHDERPAVTFDLGELLTINKVRAMIFHRDVPMTMDIEVSSDGESWHAVAERFEIAIGSEYIDIPFPVTRCQYVRMTQTETARVYGTCTEFDAWITEEEPEYDMSVVLHYEGMPNTIINIDDGLTGITLMQGDKTVLVWYNFNTIND
jgi:C1A family cysteine protease